MFINLEESATFERSNEVRSVQVDLHCLSLDETAMFVLLSSEKEIESDWKDIIIEIKNDEKTEIVPENL